MGGKAVEQGRAEQGDQAGGPLGTRPRRGGPPWPALREGVPDAGQRLGRPRRLRPSPDLWPDTDWVKNVLAAGGCQLRTRGRTIVPLDSLHMGFA